MPPKKIIAFDLDGTLTESKQEMSPEMADLTSSLSMKIKIAIVSGGAYHQFKRQVLKQILDSKNEKNLWNSTYCHQRNQFCTIRYDNHTGAHCGFHGVNGGY
jgi:phosphoserine phosphatase